MREKLIKTEFSPPLKRNNNENSQNNENKNENNQEDLIIEDRIDTIKLLQINIENSLYYAFLLQEKQEKQSISSTDKSRKVVAEIVRDLLTVYAQIQQLCEDNNKNNSNIEKM